MALHLAARPPNTLHPHILPHGCAHVLLLLLLLGCWLEAAPSLRRPTPVHVPPTPSIEALRRPPLRHARRTPLRGVVTPLALAHTWTHTRTPRVAAWPGRPGTPPHVAASAGLPAVAPLGWTPLGAPAVTTPTVRHAPTAPSHLRPTAVVGAGGTVLGGWGALLVLTLRCMAPIGRAWAGLAVAAATVAAGRPTARGGHHGVGAPAAARAHIAALGRAAAVATWGPRLHGVELVGACLCAPWGLGALGLQHWDALLQLGDEVQGALRDDDNGGTRQMRRDAIGGELSEHQNGGEHHRLSSL